MRERILRKWIGYFVLVGAKKGRVQLSAWWGGKVESKNPVGTWGKMKPTRQGGSPQLTPRAKVGRMCVHSRKITS